VDINGRQQQNNDLEKIKTTGANVRRRLHCRPNGEMDWLVRNWDDKLKESVNELTESIGSILLGRKMTEGFISYWSDVMAKPDHPDYIFAKKVIETPKVVFTKTLNKSK
jgi:dihydrofolate reductase